MEKEELILKELINALNNNGLNWLHIIEDSLHHQLESGLKSVNDISEMTTILRIYRNKYQQHMVKRIADWQIN